MIILSIIVGFMLGIMVMVMRLFVNARCESIGDAKYLAYLRGSKTLGSPIHLPRKQPGDYR